MNNRFEISPDFTIQRGQNARNIETMTEKIYKIIPERAAFIAAILAGGVYRGHSSGRSTRIFPNAG